MYDERKMDMGGVIGLKTSDYSNPDFQMDAHYGDKPLNVEELKKLVDKAGVCLVNNFRRKGFITSKEYRFITYANFDKEKNCGMNEAVYKSIVKNDDEKKMAVENMTYMQQYLEDETGRNIKLIFCRRKSNECALVDDNRFKTENEKQQMLSNYFS